MYRYNQTPASRMGDAMIYTLFFSTLRDLPPAETEEYQQRAGALRERAEAEHPGFLGMKTYVAEDGERLTVVRFEDQASQRGWKRDAAHREPRGWVNKSSSHGCPT